MFLKEKRDGTIKGCDCADGRKQRHHIIKSDATFTTILTEAVSLIKNISTKERRNVTPVDIPVAFTHTNIQGEIVRVKFEGNIDEMLEKLIQRFTTSLW